MLKIEYTQPGYRPMLPLHEIRSLVRIKPLVEATEVRITSGEAMPNTPVVTIDSRAFVRKRKTIVLSKYRQ